MIPSDIKSFINQYIASVQQLEVLLALSQNPNRHWSAEEMGNKTGLSATKATLHLLSLCIKGLAASDAPSETFYFHPKDPVIYAMVQKILEAYEKTPAPLIEFVRSQAEHKTKHHPS